MKVSATIVLLLLISVYGYLKFRESHSYKQAIAKNASLVYKLNVDGLLKTMAADFVGNPGYYLKTNKKGEGRPDFAIPANIFAYALNTGSPSTLYVGLALADTTGLNKYLKQVLKIKDFVAAAEMVATGDGTDLGSSPKKQEGKVIGTSADGKTTVAYNGKTLAIAYSFKREPVMQELNNILGQKNRMEAAAPLMVALKNAKGHLSWTTKGHTGQVNFKDGRIEVDGLVPVEGLNIPDHPHSLVHFADKALVKVWINAGLKSSLMAEVSGMLQEVSLNGISLQSYVLLKSYHGFVALELGPGITQMDSLVAYEYNDDFEKVATVQLKKVTVPHLKLSIAAKTGALTTYLKEKQVLLADDKLNKEVFPLYQVFSSQKDPIWQLSTLENDPINMIPMVKIAALAPSSSNATPVHEGNEQKDFFVASADLKGIKAQQLIPLLNSWLAPFTHLKITAAQEGNGVVRLNGKVVLQCSDINAFTQMIR